MNVNYVSVKPLTLSDKTIRMMHMSMRDLDVKDREHPGPPDLLVAVESVIISHAPDIRQENWGEQWICRTCDARLTPEEARTHTAQKLWERGYLTIPSLTLN